MGTIFFVHRIRRVNNIFDKGIEIKSDGTADANFEAAKQAYHAQLSAFAYGANANCDYVQCMITDMSGRIMTPFTETWIKPEPAPEPDAETN